jgi:hypothetical protein
VKPTIALFMFCLIISTSYADRINSGLSSSQHELNVAEAETHSTAGISNKAAPKYYRDYPQPLPPDEMHPTYEEELVNEELMPPTTVEQVSPSRSKEITRTTSRPSTINNQPNGVDIAPVIVPVYPGVPVYSPSPPGFYHPSPNMRR